VTALPSPRPTRHEVARSIAERIDWTPTYLAEFGERAAIVEQVLRAAEHETRAEVRALRAELDAQSSELTVRRLQDLVAARTPQPVEPIDLAGWSTTVTLPLAGGTPPAVVVPAGWVTIPDAAPQPAVPDGPRLDELHRALARRIGNLRKGSRKLLETSSARNAKHVALLDERDRLRDELDEARRIGADVARQRAELLRKIERSQPAVLDGVVDLGNARMVNLARQTTPAAQPGVSLAEHIAASIDWNPPRGEESTKAAIVRQILDLDDVTADRQPAVPDGEDAAAPSPKRFVGWSVVSADGDSCYGTFPSRERAEAAIASMLRRYDPGVRVEESYILDGREVRQSPAARPGEEDAPGVTLGLSPLMEAFQTVEELVGWRAPFGFVADILISCASHEHADAVRAAFAPLHGTPPDGEDALAEFVGYRWAVRDVYPDGTPYIEHPPPDALARDDGEEWARDVVGHKGGTARLYRSPVGRWAIVDESAHGVVPAAAATSPTWWRVPGWPSAHHLDDPGLPGLLVTACGKTIRDVVPTAAADEDQRCRQCPTRRPSEYRPAYRPAEHGPAVDLDGGATGG